MSRRDFEQQFFSEIEKPEQLVILYYERYKGDKTLPRWMRDLGESVRTTIGDLRAKVADLRMPEGGEAILRELLKAQAVKLGRRLLDVCVDELREIGVTEAISQKVSERHDLVLTIPYIRFLSEALPEYMFSNAGLRDRGRTPLRGDGGDMAHAIHIPYCDLWRGDRYFASFVKQHTSAGHCTIVPGLTDLPDAIAQRLHPSTANI